MTLPAYAMNQASFPEMYERLLVGPLFRPWAELTLEAVALGRGDRLLDIACGTGIVARVAKERLGNAVGVVGIDISPDMLDVARRTAPDVDWRHGKADALPLHDGEQFDVVVCQQGLQFFPDKPAAAGEMRRALANGGRLAVTTWRPDDEVPFFRDLRSVAERALGPVKDQRYGFGEAAPLEALLRAAGFRNVAVRTVSLTTRFNDAAVFVRMNAMALVGMSEAGKAMDDQERKRVTETIVSESAPVLRTYCDDPGLSIEASTNLATASG